MTMMMMALALQTVASGAAAPSASSGETAKPPVAVPPEIAVPSPAPPRPDRAHVLAAVAAEWPRYDVHRVGRLGPLEFATWVVRAHGATVAAAGIRGAPGIRPVSAMNATARAFARADANHDGGVTPDEMTDFLMR